MRLAARWGLRYVMSGEVLVATRGRTDLRVSFVLPVPELHWVIVWSMALGTDQGYSREKIAGAGSVAERSKLLSRTRLDARQG